MKQKFYKELGDYEKEVYLERLLYDVLGVDKLLDALIRAMSCNDLIDNFEYIARCHEIEIYEEE